MVEALARQVRLLEVYALKARSDGDYLGEVALKLRMLLLDSRKRKALLLRVAQLYEADLVFGATPDGRPRTWRDVLDSPMITVGGVTMTFKEFIRAWAAQVGRASEDWALDQVLVRALTNLRVNGLSVAQSSVQAITRKVLETARELLDQVEILEQLDSSSSSRVSGLSRGAHRS
jgi:hypothetical protein